jgi:hypothetical protein
MKIYLISPSHYNPDGSIHRTTRYWTSGNPEAWGTIS